jgi:arylsulfatase A-like enzyme
MTALTQRPNFVFVIPDQLRADALGCFGNERARTPHLDALAERGAVFEQTFVQHPVCSPSRASFLTGWYPHVRGHRTLTHLLQPAEPNLLRILKNSGYHVTWVGTRGDTFAPGVTELSVHEYGLTEAITRPQFRKDYPSDEWARVFYRGLLDDGLVDHDEAAVRTAERWLAEPPEGPWVLFVPLFAPHCPFQAEEPWFSLHDREAQPAPITAATGQEPRFKAGIRETYGLSRITPEMWREVAAVYHGMVSRLDDQVGRMQAALRDSGAGSNTVTAFFADHGEYLGDYGLIEKWPSAMDPCITRDPLILSGGPVPSGVRSDAMVELIDLLPTVLELAGISAPHRHFGRSLVPLLTDPGGEHREYAFTEGGFTVAEEPQLERPPFPYDLKGELQHEDPAAVGRAVAVRNREWTYVWRLYEPPELYHRTDDPHETVNLAGRPEYAEIERRLEHALLRWQIETADVIPEAADPRFTEVALPAPGAARRPR